MNITYDEEVPRRRGRPCKYADIIREFLGSDHQITVFNFDEYAPARAAYRALHILSHRNGGYKCMMRGWSVYCVKEERDGDCQV